VSSFRKSAGELKSVRCLAATGILVAAYVTMNALLAVNTETLKITFGYLALATIGMLYGPVVAALAAVPCDVITALTGSLGINPVFTVPKILEGIIYGGFLYGYASRKDRKGTASQIKWASWQIMRIFAARFSVVAVCYLLINSCLLYYVTGVSGDSFAVFMYPRYVKNVIQLPVDLALMFTLLPVLGALHNKTKRARGKERLAS
jgi:ECF transporter S component (folate family)